MDLLGRLKGGTTSKPIDSFSIRDRYYRYYYYRYHSSFKERRISKEEVESVVAGGKTLEVEVVERYWQPQKLRPLLLRWIADRPLTKDQVEGLGLPGTLADELTNLLVG